ncbi:MAG TPA: hypothetical protein VJ249_01175 [Candidatus Bathyarchaeia archaeon]|nr:hypothetical protein [Candidatus Bathyarchaeia archaeon]
MGTVPDSYYQFIMDYAPYVYVVPESGPDLSFGRAAFAAAFAIDFLTEAYNAKQFESKQAEIYAKVVSLADWLLTQQYAADPEKKAYGGFKSTETSTYYYSIDACRVIPSLLRAYTLTGTGAYLNAAKLAGATFLLNMQNPPIPSVHDKYYGGFARAVSDADAWLPEMDIENLYGLIALKMLVTEDPANKTLYESMIADLGGFLRSGFEGFWLEYRPPPSGDGQWHRVGTSENEVYDDPLAYALLGLYDSEGWSPSVENVYDFINSIRASGQYPAYNPAVCWAGYIDVASRFPACDYYDAVTAGILWKLRKNHDKSSFEHSMKIIEGHQEEFMFWGVKHADYSYVENKNAVATVAWISQLFLYYEDPITRFTQILRSRGENVTLFPVREALDTVTYGEGVDIKAMVSPSQVEEVTPEAGYIITDYIIVHVFAPIRHHDKIRRKGVDYQVTELQEFDFQGDTLYRRAVCRRLVGQ